MKTIKLLLISLLMLGSTLLANNVATVTAIKGSATITRTGSDIDAKLGSKLEEKDNIKTHENTKVQLIFSDETIISLGKNSDFSVEEFLFEDGQEPIAKFSMIKGAMRTITGKIGKIAPQKFSVSTKTATIGIRGTNFTIIAGDDGSHQVYCTYGKISVTYNSQTYIVQQGYYVDISPTGGVLIKEFNPDTLREMRVAHFGISKHLNDQLSKTGEHVQGDEENGEQLDVTVDDDSGIIVADITDDTTDAVQRKVKSLSELLASYTMNDAHYTGTYEVTSTTGYGYGLNSNGPAVLDIDFGNDTINLDLDSGGAVFNLNPSFGDTTFNVTQDNGEGSADGTFAEPTGNDVSGTFTADSGGDADSGTYDVSTSQTLH